MPTYQYRCENGHLYEETRGIKEEQKVYACPECHEHITQVYSVPGVQLKGGGFYRNSR